VTAAGGLTDGVLCIDMDRNHNKRHCPLCHSAW